MAIEYMLDYERTIVLVAALRMFMLDSANIRKFPNLVRISENLYNELLEIQRLLHDADERQ